jgi:predicted RNase H-like nuclease
VIIAEWFNNHNNGDIWETQEDFYDLVSQVFTHDNIADMLNIASNHGINSANMLDAVQSMVVDYRQSILDTQNILNNAAADGTDGIAMIETIGIVTNQYNTAKYYGDY